MELSRHDEHFERLVEELCDPKQLAAYKEKYDNHRTAFVPRVLGSMLVKLGNIVYGHEPSYLKFRAVEVIARVPYHSWASAAFTLLTFGYTDEQRALNLSTISAFSRLAADNETMHVIVISQLAAREARAGFFRHTLIPMLFAFFYFWASYILYLLNARWSLELNYLFEQHAFDQYSLFLDTHEEELKRKGVLSEYLDWYGREPRSQYEFFRTVRNDELIHRNQSIHEIELHCRKETDEST